MPGDAAGAVNDSLPVRRLAGDRVDENGEIPGRQGLHDNWSVDSSFQVTTARDASFRIGPWNSLKGPAERVARSRRRRVVGPWCKMGAGPRGSCGAGCAQHPTLRRVSRMDFSFARSLRFALRIAGAMKGANHREKPVAHLCFGASCVSSRSVSVPMCRWSPSGTVPARFASRASRLARVQRARRCTGVCDRESVRRTARFVCPIEPTGTVLDYWARVKHFDGIQTEPLPVRRYLGSHQQLGGDRLVWKAMRE